MALLCQKVVVVVFSSLMEMSLRETPFHENLLAIKPRKPVRNSNVSTDIQSVQVFPAASEIF